MNTFSDRQSYKDSLHYIFINKNGLKSDFISKFSIESYNNLLTLGFIFPCIRSTGEDSWKITKTGYDFAFLEFNIPKSSLFEKFQNWLNDVIYFNNERKIYLKNKLDKENYFK